jgi:L-amino acid N-acyltransferase YncA
VPVTLAALAPAHWDAVRKVFQEGIEGGVATFETAVPDWPTWNAAHRPDCRLVALEQGRVVGWAALSPVSKRPAYAGVAEVSVYVTSARHGEGIGRQLLSALVAAAEDAGVWMLQAVVFPQNAASLAAHVAAGFREVGRRERIARLRGAWQDTVLLERRSTRVGIE